MLTVIAVFIVLTTIIIVAATWGPHYAVAPATRRPRWPAEDDRAESFQRARFAR